MNSADLLAELFKKPGHPAFKINPRIDQVKLKRVLIPRKPAMLSNAQEMAEWNSQQELKREFRKQQRAAKRGQT
jgi:hypothetical protein